MRFIIIAILAILSACGGGDPEDNPITCEATQAVPVTGGVLGAAASAIESSEKVCH